MAEVLTFAAPSAESARSAATWSDGRVAAVVGSASAAVALAGSWIPSLWGDEAASIMSAQREWPSLFAVLGTVDAVHGFYYALLHFWIDLVGTSPFALRLPSGLAIGTAAAGLYLLVRTSAGWGVAVVAAAVFTVLPRVAQIAVEARPTPFAVAIAVWLTLLLLRLVDLRARGAWWWVYAGGLALGTYLFLYVILLVPVHVVAVVAGTLDRRRREARTPRIRPFLLAWSCAVVLAVPICVIAVLQRRQVAFRGSQPAVTFETVVVAPWFMLPTLAFAGWVLIAIGIAAAVVHRHDPSWRGRTRLLVLSAAWAVIPAAALLLVTAFATPVYTARYLVLTAPAAAIAISVGVSVLPWRRSHVIAAALIAALALPAIVDQRLPYAKNFGTDWQSVSAVVAEHSVVGDGIVFDESVRPSLRPRLAMYTYPEGFHGLVDLALVRSHDETDGLWDVTAPLSVVDHRLEGVDRVLVVLRSRRGADPDVAVLRERGFVLTALHPIESSRVAVYERDAAGTRD
ncbi:glycosyltransferase family 39 protein [Agromyces sp. NPDC004153]